jgi:hypothetical protein
MTLTAAEARFLTALAREQSQTGCRGPAHDLLKRHVFPDAPSAGRGFLAFSHEANPLIGILLNDFRDLQALDDFLRTEGLIPDPTWPWESAAEFRARLDEARRDHVRNEYEPSPRQDLSGVP